MLNFKMNMPFYLMVLYGSIMMLAVLLLRGLLKNKLPKFVFPILWSVIILRLLVPFSLSSPLSMKVPEFSMDFSIGYHETATTTVALTEDSPAPASIAEALLTGTADTAQYAENTAVETTYAMAHSDYAADHLYRGFLFIFFAGIAATASILLSQKYRYTKQLKNSLLIEHNETINALLRDMDMGHILVFTNDNIASPLVCGLLAPRIYLPTRMDFTNTEFLRHILCHETMHIRRRDNWIKWAMLIAVCVHWFNPLVWIMSKCLASDLETACDEAVLRLYNDDEARKSYAFSLLSMAVTGSRQTLLYSAFSKTEVEKRIQNIVHYKKSPVLLLAFAICLVLSSSVVFATGGQAPFSPYLSAFCASDSCRWGVKAYLTRGVSLGKNAQNRAEQIIFDIMDNDSTNDPDILENRIKAALSDEFHVEPGAFSLDFSLCLDHEELIREYAEWGLTLEDQQNNTSLRYNGETIRTYSDEMIGRYYSQQEGAVDITVVRSRLGDITSVTVYHEGDTEFDRRTQDIERGSRRYPSYTTDSRQTMSETAEAVGNDVVQETP